MLQKVLKIIGKLLMILFTLMTIGLLFIALFKKEYFLMFIEWMKWIVSMLGYWNFVIAGLSSLIESFPVLGSLLPWTNILLIVGGFFGSESTFNLIIMICIASFGAILGNLVGYLLGVYFWKEVFFKYGIYIGIGRTEVNYLEKWMERWGMWGIILGKFHATTRTFMPFIAGTTGMKSGKFMLYNTIGSIIRATSTVILWVFFVNYYQTILEYAGWIFMGILILLFWYVSLFKKEELKKYMTEKNAEMEEFIEEKQKK